MVSSLLSGRSGRPASCAAPGESPPNVAPGLLALRAPGPSAAAGHVEVSQSADGMVIRVTGDARVSVPVHCWTACSSPDTGRRS
jgi:hypothetical protein